MALISDWRTLLDLVVVTPLVLLAAAFLTWLARRRALLGRPTPVAAVEPWPREDPVSRDYLAWTAGPRSAVFLQAWTQLDRAVYRRSGRGLRQLPFRQSRARRLGLSDLPGLRRLRRSVAIRRTWHRTLEAPPIRWFWSDQSPDAWSPRASRRVDRLMTEVDRRLRLLGGTR